MFYMASFIMCCYDYYNGFFYTPRSFVFKIMQLNCPVLKIVQLKYIQCVSGKGYTQLLPEQLGKDRKIMQRLFFFVAKNIPLKKTKTLIQQWPLHLFSKCGIFFGDTLVKMVCLTLAANNFYNLRIKSRKQQQYFFYRQIH